MCTQEDSKRQMLDAQTFQSSSTDLHVDEQGLRLANAAAAVQREHICGVLGRGALGAAYLARLEYTSSHAAF